MEAKAWLKQCNDRAVQANLPPRERTVTLPPGLPKFTLGYEALAWIETNLKVPSGPRAGRPFEASIDQALFLLWFYAVDENGKWLYNRGVRRLAKGSGKTPFAAAMALFELLGPARVMVFDETVPGGVVGMPVHLPLVQIAATSEQQTGVTMRVLRGMAHKRTALAKKYQLDTGKTYVETPEGGKIQLLTSSATSAEGFESSFVIADETEHWTPGVGGPDMAQTLRRNLAKTGNRMLETCNAWIPGRDSVSESSFDDWCEQEEGNTVADQKVLYDARVAPANTVLTDTPEPNEVSITDALQFVYEPMPWAAVDAMKQEIWSPSTPTSVSRRFYLNQPNARDDAWVTLQDWAVLANPDRELVEGEDIVMFFDGSKSNDHSALVGCCMSDGFIFTIGVWKPEKLTGTVNYRAIDSTVTRMKDTYNVVAFWADVREFESFVKVSWPERFGDELLVPAQAHGKAASSIAWDMRSHGYDFAMATEMCHAEIEDGMFQHDGNWETSKHIGNCRMTERRGHITVKKESPKSPNKIDAAVCVIGARMVYRAVKASPEWENYLGATEDWVVY